MPTNVLSRLLPDFHIALQRLHGDMSVLSITAVWLRDQILMELDSSKGDRASQGDRTSASNTPRIGPTSTDTYIQALNDMDQAIGDSLRRVEALGKVYQALNLGQSAADELKDLTKNLMRNTQTNKGPGKQ